MSARLVNPRRQKLRAVVQETGLVVAVQGIQGARAFFDGRVPLARGPQTLVSDVGIGLFEAALGIKRLHVHHAIHADDRFRIEARQQRVPTLRPEVPADAQPPQFRTDQKEPHESEFGAVSDHTPTGNQRPIPMEAPIALGVLNPEGFSVMAPGIPPFEIAPIHEHIEVRAVQGGEPQVLDAVCRKIGRNGLLRPSAHCNSKLN